MIEIKDLSYTYAGSSSPALNRVNLRIREGEFVVIAGPSGCGKSTLALAIGGYLNHQFQGHLEGELLVRGLDVSRCPLYQVADVVGLVQQNPENQLCTLTVSDEIAFGPENRLSAREPIEAQRDWALRTVLAESLLDRSLSSLSGGEKQKVAIASMLVGEPRVLMFDEPTSNLDPTATAAIFDVLEKVRRESAITIVVIEHKLDYLRRFNPRLVRMEAGSIRDDSARIEPTPPVPTRQPAPAGEPSITVEHLACDFEAIHALEDVSATLAAGQLVAVMGDNGSGKTTFLRCLVGLLRPTSGRVVVLGSDMSAQRVSDLVQHMGYLFQNPDHQLLANTIWEEAMLLGRNVGACERFSERAERLLREMGLTPRRDDHPFRLSYGEKRRLNLVSVTAHDPQIVLADEILIGQDPANAQYIMEYLRDIADRGGCVVQALHDPHIALRYADRVLFFASGRVIVDAPPQAALAELGELGYTAYARA